MLTLRSFDLYRRKPATRRSASMSCKCPCRRSIAQVLVVHTPDNVNDLPLIGFRNIFTLSDVPTTVDNLARPSASPPRVFWRRYTVITIRMMRRWFTGASDNNVANGDYILRDGFAEIDNTRVHCFRQLVLFLPDFRHVGHQNRSAIEYLLFNRLCSVIGIPEDTDHRGEQDHGHKRIYDGDIYLYACGFPGIVGGCPNLIPLLSYTDEKGPGTPAAACAGCSKQP